MHAAILLAAGIFLHGLCASTCTSRFPYRCYAAQTVRSCSVELHVFVNTLLNCILLWPCCKIGKLDKDHTTDVSAVSNRAVTNVRPSPNTCCSGKQNVTWCKYVLSVSGCPDCYKHRPLFEAIDVLSLATHTLATVPA